MKKCYLDSNVLVYLKDNNSPHQHGAVDLVTSLVSAAYELFLSPLTIDEFLHSSMFILGQHKISQDERFRRMKEGLMSLLHLSQVHIVNPPIHKESHLRILILMQDFRLRPRDAYHLLTMQENGIDEFATFDNDFKLVFARKLIRRAA